MGERERRFSALQVLRSRWYDQVSGQLQRKASKDKTGQDAMRPVRADQRETFDAAPPMRPERPDQRAAPPPTRPERPDQRVALGQSLAGGFHVGDVVVCRGAARATVLGPPARK